MTRKDTQTLENGSGPAAQVHPADAPAGPEADLRPDGFPAAEAGLHRADASLDPAMAAGMHATVDVAGSSIGWTIRLRRNLSEANRELWLILSMLAIAAVLNYLMVGHRLILGFYTFPTLLSAYFFGRRHAILTATTSVALVVLLARINPRLFADAVKIGFLHGRWFDISAWGGILILIAFAMGTLHERHRAKVNELRQTYHGLLMILRHFVSNDKYTENHSYRVSVYAVKIAAVMGLDSRRIEDTRAASLLHDIGKLETSRNLLYKAARLSKQEYEQIKLHAGKGAHMLRPVGGPLSRVIPIILAHHERFDGSGYQGARGVEIPLEARIIAVADVYDALTSDRPYRKAMSPFEARATIVKGAGDEFDPTVVEAFVEAFRRNEMEVPEVVV